MNYYEVNTNQGGNIILGFMSGYFMRRGLGVILSVLLAFAIQLPWLYLSDVYLAGMPRALVVNIMIALFATNIVWATVARYTYKRIERLAK